MFSNERQHWALEVVRAGGRVQAEGWCPLGPQLQAAPGLPGLRQALASPSCSALCLVRVLATGIEVTGNPPSPVTSGTGPWVRAELTDKLGARTFLRGEHGHHGAEGPLPLVVVDAHSDLVQGERHDALIPEDVSGGVCGRDHSLDPAGGSQRAEGDDVPKAFAVLLLFRDRLLGETRPVSRDTARQRP